MKISPSRRGFLLAVLAGTCLFPSVSQAAVTVVGSGPDTSFLVLESPGLGVRTYEVHYTYNSGASQDAYFLLGEVMNSDASYVVSFSNYGTPSSPNYFINSINGEAGTFVEPYVYWTHWVSGGSGYQNPNFSYNPGTPPAGSWSVGYGISTHFIAPGSWDVLFYSDGNTLPTTSPVPETSSVLLGLLGSLGVFKRRRNR